MEQQRMLLLCDLPLEKRIAAQRSEAFQRGFVCEGFSELQENVYTRMVESRSSGDVHIERISKKLPSYGRVRLIALMEKQFQNAPLLCGEEDKRAITGSELDVFI